MPHCVHLSLAPDSVRLRDRLSYDDVFPHIAQDQRYYSSLTWGQFKYAMDELVKRGCLPYGESVEKPEEISF